MTGYESAVNGCYHQIASNASSFGASWQAFASDMQGDAHLGDIESAHVTPLVSEQYQLLQALEGLRQAARELDRELEETERDAERARRQTEGW